MFHTFFDLHGGYFDHPRLMEEVANINTIMTRSKDYDRSSVAEVLLVADEPTCSYCTFDSRLLSETLGPVQRILAKIGMPYDAVLIDDLDKADMDRYKLVIFLNTWHMDDHQRDLVEQYAKGGDRVLLWIYAPGLFNLQNESADAMAELAGIEIKPADDESFIAPRIELTGSDHALAQRWREAGLQTVGPDQRLCKLFEVTDVTAQTLGALPGTNAVTLAIKDMGDWTSVYSITAIVPPAFYRELARHAGAHVYNERDDALYISTNYLCVNADGEGTRRITLPQKCDVFDPLTGETLQAGTETIERPLADHESMLVRYQKSE
jgi:hypothetical protein